MTHISKINVNTNDSIESCIQDIIQTIEGLDFDWCNEPVEVTISDPDYKGTWLPKFDIFVENNGGCFGFSV